MIENLARIADRVSFAAAVVAMGMILALVFTMVYEVVARYIFDAPTVWAYDISYMLNGALFLLGAGLTLARNNHVRIDFLSSRLPVRGQHAANLAFYLLLFLPGMGAAAWASIVAAWQALVTGQVEAVSPWAPLIWPFYGAIAVGLAALWLQALAEALRHALGMRDPDAVRAPNVMLPH